MRIENIEYIVRTDHGELLVPIEDLRNQKTFEKHCLEQLGVEWPHMHTAQFRFMIDEALRNHGDVRQLDKALREYVGKQIGRPNHKAENIHTGKILFDRKNSTGLFRLQCFLDFLEIKGWRLSRCRVVAGLRELGVTQRNNTTIGGHQIRPMVIDLAQMKVT